MEKVIKKKISRRNMVKSVGLGLATITTTVMTKKALPLKKESPKKKLAMVIDLRRCYGCVSCSIACKSENGVFLGNFRSWVAQVNTGTFPKARRHFVPRLCNHCENPICVRVCPTTASYVRQEDGIVMVNKDICIGCRYCMNACPYGVRSFVWNNGIKKDLDYPSQRSGVVDKCDLCVHRLENGIVPSCVNTCPARARIIGDLNDKNSEIYNLVANNSVQTLLPELGTKPKVYYIGLDLFVAEEVIKAGVRHSPLEMDRNKI